MTRSSLLPMGGKGSLIVCGWGCCCRWGQETTCKRGPIWHALFATHGREKNLEVMGEAVVHRAKKSLHTKEDNIMPIVNEWISWLVYVVVWYICDKLPYVRFYDFGIILLVLTDYNIEFHGIILRNFMFHHLIILVILLLKMILQYSVRNFPN